MNDRAVSDTLGFVLLFAIILFSIGVVATAGVDSLEDVRDATLSNNAGQSFQTLAGDLDDIHRHNVSARTTSVRLGQGQLRNGDPTRITVDVYADGTPEIDREVTPIVYEIDDTRLVYETGAVIREQDGGGAVLVREPPFSFRADRAIVPVVDTTPHGDSPAAASGSNAQVYLARTSRGVESLETGAGTTVRITVDTSEVRADVWEAYLNEAMPSSSCSRPSTTVVRCDYSVGGSPEPTVLARLTEVTYEFDV